MRLSGITILFILAISGAQAINGSLETIGEIQILNLWGTWEEMGYAHGYLLGPDLKEVFESYLFELAGGTGTIDLMRIYMTLYFDIPDEFREYADGIITGAADSISLWSDVYGRNLDTLDLYLVSAIPDLSAMADIQPLFCSSVSAWENATSGDPELQGDPAISRNLDYYVDTQETILENNLLIVYDPVDGQEWISVAFPGFMACLSGMNWHGINAALNMGNYQGTSQTNPAFVPICMALALGLSEEDFDGSGTCDITDMMTALTYWNRANSYDIHLTSPALSGTSGFPATVVEVNNHQGYEFRLATDEPSISPDRMILTNHHRILYPPVPCDRYEKLLDSLTTNPDVSSDRLWDFMGAVGYVPAPGYGGTIQTMIFHPEQRTLGLAFSTSGIASWQKDPEWIEWGDIFPNHDPQFVEENPTPDTNELFLFPNPAIEFLYISSGNCPIADIRIYDLSGRQMGIKACELGDCFFSLDLTDFPAGLYRLVSGTGENRMQLSFIVLK